MITPNTRYVFNKPTRVAEGKTVPKGYIVKTDKQSQVTDILGTGKTVSVYALHNWLEDKRIEEAGRWTPATGDTYFFVTSKGKVEHATFLGSEAARRRAAFGNAFETREQATKVRDALKELLNGLSFDDE